MIWQRHWWRRRIWLLNTCTRKENRTQWGWHPPSLPIYPGSTEIPIDPQSNLGLFSPTDQNEFSTEFVHLFHFIRVALNLKHPGQRSQPSAGTKYKGFPIASTFTIWAWNSHPDSGSQSNSQIRFHRVGILLASNSKSRQLLVSKHLIFARVVLSNGIQQGATCVPWPHRCLKKGSDH